MEDPERVLDERVQEELGIHGGLAPLPDERGHRYPRRRSAR